MKRIFAILLVLCLMCGYMASAENNASISVRGALMNFHADTDRTGTVYIPVREVAEQLGYKVTWNAERGTVTLMGDAGNFLIHSGSEIACKNQAQTIVLGSLVKHINAKTMMTPSAFQKMLGISCTFDEYVNTVIVK